MALLTAAARCPTRAPPAGLVRGAVAAGLVLCGVVGCRTLQPTQERLQELVGMPSSRLQPLFGAPVDVIEDGETEYLRYAWVIANVESVTVRRSESYARPAERPSVDAFCELVVEVRDRVVTAVEVRGRTTRNGLYDAGCSRMAAARMRGR